MTDEMKSGLYVAAFFSDKTNQHLAQYIADNNIPNPVTSQSFHTTIVYSRVPVDDFEANHSADVTISSQNVFLEAWDVANNKQCLVLRFPSNYLELRFAEAMAAGATYDFDEYKAHVSLSYDLPVDFDIRALPVINFPIHIIGEYSEPLELDDDEIEALDMID